ncbi:MAG: MSMEG_1061 family FMN-dependent PPOX-type flavoprotein [Alphaproteobacteria bacterium]
MTQDNRFREFKEQVSSAEELEGLIGAPKQMVIDKVQDHLDEVSRAFIKQSPFLVMASTGVGDYIDLSPKGDPAGFVKILDDHHLAIPDRPGNKRVDTFHNLLKNPQIGLIFLIPGKTETLRVSGEARLVRDPDLLESMAVKGKAPSLAMVVHVERAFVHCPKCMIRSGLWNPESWEESSSLPDIGEAMIKQAHLDTTPEELFEEAEREGLTKLY